MDIAVEELKVGDRLVLLNGRGVQVEKVSFVGEEGDEQMIVRWHSGHVIRGGRVPGERETLGSFLSRRRGETISVQHRLEEVGA